VFLFDARKGTEKGCVCGRKSCKRSEKQGCRPPLPGSQLRWRAVRKAHSEKPLDRPENECIHFLAGQRFFLRPEAPLALSELQAQIVCYCFQADSPGEVQEMKSPGAELETAEVSNVSSLSFVPSRQNRMNSHSSRPLYRRVRLRARIPATRSKPGWLVITFRLQPGWRCTSPFMARYRASHCLRSPSRSP